MLLRALAHCEYLFVNCTAIAVAVIDLFGVRRELAYGSIVLQASFDLLLHRFRSLCGVDTKRDVAPHKARGPMRCSCT